ncbi:substrate-binding periplasmic protein [Chitinolyticbacter meiyuanensis]|uniref:substrate-binding periplasmic protein n=1 Tax=Chitinolyticbacter meiyuanensis TaxID=682798 RepID=UPI0016526CAB|nr:transporter substrate-binding domain-containing protein [Chitinolyticbacter meiyuanensis]
MTRLNHWLPCLLALTLTTAHTAELRVGVGLDKPPYVIQQQDGGIELDLARAILGYRGHTVHPVYLPQPRLPAALRDGQIDVALTMQPGAVGGTIYFSHPYITYRNVAVSLAQRQLRPQRIAELASYHVLAFGNARQLLGDEFALMAEHNPRYNEMSDQRRQVLMLFADRTEFIVLDERIFGYFREHPGARVDTDQAVNLHTIFPERDYLAAFRDPQRRDDFNAGLRALRASGRYTAILAGQRHAPED